MTGYEVTVANCFLAVIGQAINKNLPKKETPSYLLFLWLLWFVGSYSWGTFPRSTALTLCEPLIVSKVRSEALKHQANIFVSGKLGGGMGV